MFRIEVTKKAIEKGQSATYGSMWRSQTCPVARSFTAKGFTNVRVSASFADVHDNKGNRLLINLSPKVGKFIKRCDNNRYSVNFKPFSFLVGTQAEADARSKN